MWRQQQKLCRDTFRSLVFNLQVVTKVGHQVAEQDSYLLCFLVNLTVFLLLTSPPPSAHIPGGVV